MSFFLKPLGLIEMGMITEGKEMPKISSTHVLFESICREA